MSEDYDLRSLETTWPATSTSSTAYQDNIFRYRAKTEHLTSSDESCCLHEGEPRSERCAPSDSRGLTTDTLTIEMLMIHLDRLCSDECVAEAESQTLSIRAGEIRHKVPVLRCCEDETKVVWIVSALVAMCRRMQSKDHSPDQASSDTKLMQHKNECTAYMTLSDEMGLTEVGRASQSATLARNVCG